MFKRLLVPVDGSEPSNKAVDLALSIAKDSGGSVRFIHCVDTARVAALLGPAGVGLAEALEAVRKNGQQVLDDANEQARRAGVRSDSDFVDGEPVQSVLDAVRQHEPEVVVIGSHGRGGLARAFLGSVAEGIARHSQVPVLLCHAQVGESPNRG